MKKNDTELSETERTNRCGEKLCEHPLLRERFEQASLEVRCLKKKS